jgi:hypothetical protein
MSRQIQDSGWQLTKNLTSVLVDKTIDSLKYFNIRLSVSQNIKIYQKFFHFMVSVINFRNFQLILNEFLCLI